MGCKFCNREEQIVEPNIIEKKEEMEKVVDELQLDFPKARRLVKFLLSEDNLYRKTLNYVLLFNDEQFENLFKGNDEYRNYPYNNIGDRNEFRYLLMKFQDFNSFLYEWYKDESKYDALIKLWKANLCIYELSKNSDDEIETTLQDLGVTGSEDFLSELREVLHNSLESKSSDIRNYLRDEYEDFYKLIETTDDYKEEFKKTDINNKDIIIENLKNIGMKLVEKSIPLVKDYLLKKYPNLNILAKIQLKDGILKKLKDAMMNEITNDDNISKGIGFDTITDIIDAFKNGNVITKIVSSLENYYSQPIVAVTALTQSFLNVTTSIKTYYDDYIEFDQKNIEYTKRIDEIHNEFEGYKNELGLLDLENYEESMKKLVTIGKKINDNKKKVSKVIKDLENEEKETEKTKKKDNYKDIAKNGFCLLSCAAGCVLTGGVSAIAFGIAAVGNGIALSMNFSRLLELKKQLNHYKETKDKESKKFEEIELKIGEIKNLYNNLNDRYIPRNILHNNN